MAGTERKDIVRMAVSRGYPRRVPLLYFNEFKERSDILMIGYDEAADFPARGTKASEWGFEWERLDGTMGQPKNPPLADWDALRGYRFPDPDARGRYDRVGEAVARNADRYLIASLGITGFNHVTFLRGFENAMADLYLDRRRIEGLIDEVLSFEKAVIRRFGAFAFDAVAFGDDWGTQNSLLISPVLWRELFKERFRAQFDLVHSLGMRVFFHSCGQIWDIIPDLIEIGADILNLNQPDLFGVERLGEEFGGKACFCCPVDHQTVAIRGDRGEIFDYVRRLKASLGGPAGGFIGYIEEYSSIGMSRDNFQSILDAFEEGVEA
jgi:uroporphyrinogen decarboxylase